MARVWDVTTGDLLLTLPVSPPFGFSDIAFRPDGRLLVTGGDDKAATLWDAETGDQLDRLFGHVGNVEAVAFSPDGRFVATGSTDGAAKIWDASDGREVLSLAGHSTAVVNVDFSPDGGRLATGAIDGTARSGT